MAETRNIVVLGGSTAGLGAAHSFLKHTYPALKAAQPSVKYVVHMVDPSSHYWWRISAPRAMTATAEFPTDKTFLPIADGFKHYEKGVFVFHQAAAKAVDTAARTVTLESSASKETEKLSYYALVIATGTRTPTPATSVLGDHKKSISALAEIEKRLETATSIVIGGGGPVSVETAGEIGEKLNGAAGWFKARPSAPKAKVTIVTASDKLLPVLPLGQSTKAEKFLNRVGVDVVYKTRVDKVDLSKADAALLSDSYEAEHTSSGGEKSTVFLSNGEKLTADIFIPAIGVKPNTEFLAKELLNDKGYIKSDTHLRVTGAGEHVYCVGDCGAYTVGGMMSMPPGVTVVTASIAKDLEGDKSTRKDQEYTFQLGQSQAVPVGRSKGVGAMKGTSLPSIMVWAIKGRGYLLQYMAKNHNGAAW